MKSLLVILMLLLFPLAGEATELPEPRPQTPPRQHQWSETSTFVARHTYYTDHIPVLRDDQGNFHQVSWLPQHDESFLLAHKVLNVRGEVENYNEIEIPGLTEYAGVALTPEGLLVIWLEHRVVPGDDTTGEMLLLGAVVDSQGNILRQSELSYHLPEGTPGLRLDYFEMAWRVHPLVDSDGIIHLSLQGGDRSMFRSYYFQFDAEFNLLAVDSGKNNASPHAMMGGELGKDQQGNIYIVYSVREAVWLMKFSPEGEKLYEQQVAEQVFSLAGEPTNEYTRRGRGPALAVDERGVVHIAYSYLVQARMGQEVVDIHYLQVVDGEVEVEKKLTDSTGRARFPTITLENQRVTICWEQPSGGQQRLWFTTLGLVEDKPFEILFENVQLIFSEGFSSSGLVWAHDDNHFSAAWWLGAGSDRQLAFKTTYNPQPQTIWHQFGIIDDFSRRGTLGQVLFWLAMVLLLAAVQFFANLHVLLAAALVLYLLYRLQLLEPLLEQPWRMLVLLLIMAFALVQPLAVAREIAGEGYHLFAALVALSLVVGGSLLLQVNYQSSLNLILGCVAWLYLMMLVQVAPAVPQLIGM